MGEKINFLFLEWVGSFTIIICKKDVGYKTNTVQTSFIHFTPKGLIICVINISDRCLKGTVGIMYLSAYHLPQPKVINLISS